MSIETDCMKRMDRLKRLGETIIKRYKSIYKEEGIDLIYFDSFIKEVRKELKEVGE